MQVQTIKNMHVKKKTHAGISLIHPPNKHVRVRPFVFLLWMVYHFKE